MFFVPLFEFGEHFVFTSVQSNLKDFPVDGFMFVVKGSETLHDLAKLNITVKDNVPWPCLFYMRIYIYIYLIQTYIYIHCLHIHMLRERSCTECRYTDIQIYRCRLRHWDKQVYIVFCHSAGAWYVTTATLQYLFLAGHGWSQMPKTLW